MATANQDKLQKIISVLVQLDDKSLLLIDSGVKLLAARQKMDMDTQNRLDSNQKEELQEV